MSICFPTEHQLTRFQITFSVRFMCEISGSSRQGLNWDSSVCNAEYLSGEYRLDPEYGLI